MPVTLIVLSFLVLATAMTADSGAPAPWCATGPGLAVVTPVHSVVGVSEPRPDQSPANGGGLLVDVMVVYTPSSRMAVGSTAAIEALIESYFTYTNTAYEQSGVLHRFRLVHSQEVQYVESGNSITDLNRLRDPDDGFMDEVHPLRDTWGADLVSLINTSGSAGVAFQMLELSRAFESSAFSAIGADTGPLNPGLVFAHEAGHNMGCTHNNEPGGGTGIFCYSFGYRTPDEQWRTIMSSSPGTFVDLFSSPELEIDGQPLGIPGDGCPPGAADNVRSLNEAAATVAAFRPTVGPPPCPWDLDGSGTVGINDFLDLLVQWGMDPGGPPDFDGDGTVGILDFLALLANWGPCPRR